MHTLRVKPRDFYIFILLLKSENLVDGGLLLGKFLAVLCYFNFFILFFPHSTASVVVGKKLLYIGSPSEIERIIEHFHHPPMVLESSSTL